MDQTERRMRLDADAARDARMLLQREVRERLEQERAMRALAIGTGELPAADAQSKWRSVAHNLREHPVGIGIGALAAGVAIRRAMQSRA